MDISKLVEQIKDNNPMSAEDIEEFIDLVAKHKIDQTQIEAWLKAVHEYGISNDETTTLTSAMMRSGIVFEWGDSHPLIVDKHSTGGVGDKMSIPLAPALAACGLKVPMLSGRGLGHTGGTVDKLEAIPGFNTSQSPKNMQKIIANIGCCIAAQNATIAPADGILYAIRDVSDTVDSIPLICASIISKKAAENPKSLVLDVKCGRAAFMKTEEDARLLAEAMVNTAIGLGISTKAQLTRMDHPIGRMIGNSLEIIESVELMQGKGPLDSEDIIALQGGSLLKMAGVSIDDSEGEEMIRNALKSGAALNKFRQMCVAQGVDEVVAKQLCERPSEVLPLASQVTTLTTDVGGWVADLNALNMAEITRRLGAGRFMISDDIDAGVGLALHCEIGMQLHPGQAWVSVYHNGNLSTEDSKLLENSISLSSEKVVKLERHIDTIG
ncbi:MAG: thymidine phosphorylase [Euryarchaeota archaeon]|nr:thymidine phosphorylase [Euryarchaeota archaeon]